MHIQGVARLVVLRIILQVLFVVPEARSAAAAAAAAAADGTAEGGRAPRWVARRETGVPGVAGGRKAALGARRAVQRRAVRRDPLPSEHHRQAPRVIADTAVLAPLLLGVGGR